MINWKNLVFVGAVVSMFGFAGCGDVAEDQLDDGEVEESIDSKDDGAQHIRLGHYEIDPMFGPFFGLTLAENHQYVLNGGCRPGPTGPHCFAIIRNEGTFKLTHSGSTHFLRLTSDFDGSLMAKFSYVVNGAGASVTATDMKTGEVVTFKILQN